MEDAYNFLAKTHSVSDWAASQFKHDHYGVTTSSWCESLDSVYTKRHFKEASLCDFMCSVYNYTVNLLCSRRDSIINKPADGTVLTQKGLEVYKKVKERSEMSELQHRVESKVGNECLVSRKDCLGNKQTVRTDKMTCSCGCYRCLCPHLMCALCECTKENNALTFLSTVYGAEGYKESYTFTDSDSPIHYTRGAKVSDLCEWR